MLYCCSVRLGLQVEGRELQKQGHKATAMVRMCVGLCVVCVCVDVKVCV